MLIPPSHINKPIQDPVKESLSDIIKSLNEIYGVEITDDDKINLNIISENIFKDEEFKKFYKEIILKRIKCNFIEKI